MLLRIPFARFATRNANRKGKKIQKKIRWPINRPQETTVESYIQTVNDTEAHIIEADLFNMEGYPVKKYDHTDYVRGLPKDEEPLPISPRLGPYLVESKPFIVKQKDENCLGF